MSKKIILIDGNSLVYRAFYALPTTLTTKDGAITNAVYGFTSMLIRLLREERPDGMAVAFDRAAPTFRHLEFKEYKAHRPPMPDELFPQLGLVHRVLDALKIKIYELDGFEADDVLATLACEAREEGDRVIIVTSDRDALQLVNDHVVVMATRKGITDTKLYDREAVIERFGLPPEKMTDMLALKGDTSDNIPGIPGIGDKTASKFISEFGSLENLYERVDEVKPERFRQVLKDHEEQAKVAKRLATLDRKAPIEIDVDEIKVGRWDEAEVRRVFHSLEFYTLADRFSEAARGSARSADERITGESRIAEAKVRVHKLASQDDIISAISSLDGPLAVEVPATGTAVEPAITAAAFCVDGAEAFAIDFPEGQAANYLSPLRDLLTRPGVRIAHDTKSAMLALEGVGIKTAFSSDTMLAAYLLDPSPDAYLVRDLAAQYLDFALPETEDASVEAGYRASAVRQLAEKLEEELKKSDLDGVYRDIELPLPPVLARMERTGVGIDTKLLKEYSKELEIQLGTITEDVFRLAAAEFNINSPQQVGEVLFDRLGLPPGKKTKTGWSTDVSVLQKLAAAHPIAERILAYREVAKLKSTYVDALPKLANRKTGRLHTSFNQTVTSTGRLSSTNPNLQNIPVKGEMGLRIREAFVPAHATDELLVADYSQIELRLLAHLSEDPVLLGAFARGEDIHTATAASVFGVKLEDTNPSMRRAAKVVNFGIIYGMQAHGLSQSLGISVGEAQDYIDKYFQKHPKVRAFIDGTIAAAHRDGFVRTMFGRRRFMPELKSGNYRVKSLGERLAVNTPLQGASADIIKLAMIELDRELESRGLRARMVLQVHDELILEVPPIERDLVTDLVRRVMEGVAELSAPLEVEISLGRNWREAK